MIVRVRLFARARDLAGEDALEIDLPSGGSVADLRARLGETCPALKPLLTRAAVAVNEEFAGDEVIVLPSAEVALLPPVSGGSDG
jgi:molybdopterin converting factor subunit 1